MLVKVKVEVFMLVETRGGTKPCASKKQMHVLPRASLGYPRKQPAISEPAWWQMRGSFLSEHVPQIINTSAHQVDPCIRARIKLSYDLKDGAKGTCLSLHQLSRHSATPKHT